MQRIIQKFKKNVKSIIAILMKLLPVFAFIIPFIILFSLYPKSFEGDPTWEGSWQGRFFYLFFLWLASLEMIISWEKLANKVNKLESKRTLAFISALLLPTIYVVVANYYGLNTIIKSLAERNNVFHANLMPLITEYMVFATVFCLIILLAYGINRLADFSISVFFLGIIGLLYTIDDVYPGGRFTPLQMFVSPTATLAANMLNLMGYITNSFQMTSSTLGQLFYLSVQDSTNPSKFAQFAIAWPCAGVESLLIYAITILLFLKKTAIPLWQRITYFAIGATVTYFVNVLRIVSIYIVAINSGASEVTRFHNIYGPLYSISWIMAYPLIIIGSRALWGKIRNRKN